MMKRQSKSLANGLAMTRRWMDHGLISPDRQRHYEQLFGPMPALISAGAIRRFLRRIDIDEAVFARACNRGPQHVRGWEQGRGHPRGPELKLIHLTRKRGLNALA